MVDDVVVPDFRGWHPVEAWLVGTSLRLACQCRGLGGRFLRVVEQDPLPGTGVRPGSILALFLEEAPGLDDDGGGVREPRRPLPLGLEGRGEKPLPHG